VIKKNDRLQPLARWAKIGWRTLVHLYSKHFVINIISANI